MFTIEERAIHYLLLKSHFLKELGLFYGKIGVAITFFDYGRKVNNKIFYDHARELIEGILNKIDHRINNDFGTGLAGIAWGIEYMVQNKYIDENSNSLCTDIDDRMMLISFERMTDLSLETGIEGILHYILSRFKGSLTSNNTTLFDKSFLDDLNDKITHVKKLEISKDLRYLIDEFIYFMRNNTIFSYNLCSRSFYIGNTNLNEIENNMPLGLRKGLSGWINNTCMKKL